MEMNRIVEKGIYPQSFINSSGAPLHRPIK